MCTYVAELLLVMTSNC